MYVCLCVASKQQFEDCLVIEVRDLRITELAHLLLPDVVPYAQCNDGMRIVDFL